MLYHKQIVENDIRPYEQGQRIVEAEAIEQDGKRDHVGFLGQDVEDPNEDLFQKSLK